MKTLKFITFSFLFLFIALAITAQEVNLTLKPVVNKKYDLIIKSRSDITQTMAGMEVKVKTSYTANAIMEIQEVNSNGDFSALTTWKDYKFTTSMMGNDSTQEADNVNVLFKTKYDKSGKTLNSKIIETKGATNAAITILYQLAKNMKLNILSAKPTKKGDSWQIQSRDSIPASELSMAMIIDKEDNYQFEGSITEDGVEYYKIICSGPMKILGDAKQAGMDMHIEGTGMTEGISLIDKTTLFPVRIQDRSGLDMSIIITGPQSMAIPVNQNTETVIQFSEIK